MATYQRGDLFIVTSVEELPWGRYRGFVTFTAGVQPAASSRHTCTRCWDNPLQAHEDADAEVEYAYRHYLSDHTDWSSRAGSTEH
ncbi:hypothetical protein ACU4GI_24090 [Cupriavidus basilensis]|uniref:hypothetical protein n=1 Tax=unclassified Cupriavidus TaxID=2640874 RepID=UPI00044A600A|nr:hypothetical protein [Cupriavidus sp. SK-3]KDP89069.1 hypothetical protein CF70_025090 [Cupriavidus sp. SK-3]